MRRSTAAASAAWSRKDWRNHRTNFTLRCVARRACSTTVDTGVPFSHTPGPAFPPVSRAADLPLRCSPPMLPLQFRFVALHQIMRDGDQQRRRERPGAESHDPAERVRFASPWLVPFRQSGYARLAPLHQPGAYADSQLVASAHVWHRLGQRRGVYQREV